MADEGFKRKLTAILSADVIGYSRLMRDDEEATVRDLAAHRVLISEIIQEHHGRVVDSPGDNILAEFASVVDAVKGAIKIQQEIKKRNADTPEDRRMEFRIGVNLGDVIEEEERIYGDGVNIAARVEGLAAGGGIAISGTVYEHIKEKLSLGYHYLGEQDVKNISELVQVYRLLTEPDDSGKMIGVKKPKKWRWVQAAVVMLALIVGTFFISNIYFGPPPIEPASVDKMAFPLPEKPSIAVLPFDNLSGDPEQDYISDGLTENIISAISQIPEMFVIARNSMFTYKGKPVKVKQVSEELGVKYVLEGSVQKVGDRLRINAQLIDALKGHHLWAEKYDRDFKNIFELQDEITLNVIAALEIKLTQGEEMRLWSKENQDLDIYLKSAKAASLAREGNRESMVRFGQLAQEIFDMAPDQPLGYRLLSWYYASWDNPERSLKKAYDMAQKALALNESDPFTHALFSSIFRQTKEYDKAIESGMRAVELLPNGAQAHYMLGESLLYTCRFDEAMVHLKHAIRLNPLPYFHHYFMLGLCYFHKGQYEEALSEFKKTLQCAPDAGWVYLPLAMTYALLNREEEARASAVKAVELVPEMSVTLISKIYPYRCKDNFKLYLDTMRKAGFPE